MIKPEELRIGNWVETYTVLMSGSWYDKSGKQHGHDVITEPGIRQKQIDVKDLEILSGPQGFLATYRPIPITPEILEKCGFKNDVENDAADMIFGEFRIFAGHHEWWFWGHESPIDIGMKINVRLDYLHQLQNLYFALTGEELNYKP